MPDNTNVIISPGSTKGILALGVVLTYAFMWAYAIFTVLNGLQNGLTTGEATEFLMQFAGATGVMGVIVVIVIQNFFRKTEAQ